MIRKKQKHVFCLRQFSSLVELEELTFEDQHRKIEVTWILREHYAAIMGVHELIFIYKPLFVDLPKFP